MEIKFHGHNLRVHDGIEEYTRKKLDRLDRYLPNITDVWVELTRQNTARTGDYVSAQITLRHERGAILRAEERVKGDNHEAVLAAINQVVNKMYRQIERFKGKRTRKGKLDRERFTATPEELEVAEELPTEEIIPEQAPVTADYDEYEDQIVRRKQIAVTSMTEDEAIEQMELLGHKFFMFYNTHTNSVNVLYRRDVGGYGVLVPQSQ
jgi:putative sigma-54 modulation protein